MRICHPSWASYLEIKRDNLLMLRIPSAIALALLLYSFATAAQPANSNGIVFTPDPASSAVTFSLDATMHTVHGSFAMKKSTIQFTAGTNQIGGEIVLDATSAKTGNGSRDNKMHKDVLESARFPEIIFRPDKVDGTIALQGKSEVRIHGMFTIHGAQHEMVVPTEVAINPRQWQATSHFTVPYVSWGMKNPSNLFLHVKDTVEIEVKLAGETPSAAKQ
jgi:polyisoprenoid-binding protein YceI